MMKYRFKCGAAFVFCAFFLSDAAAQTADVIRRLNAKYDRVMPFNEGLAMVSGNGRYGYVNTQGEVVVPLIYDEATSFRNGRAAVGKGKAEVCKQAMIDRSGHEITPFAWDHLGNVADGVAVAWTRRGATRSYALVDTLGRVTPLEYALCGDFSNGYAAVGVGELTVEKVVQPGMSRVPDKLTFTGKYGYIAPDGSLVIQAQFDEAGKFGDDGLAPVGMQGKYYVKWGFADRDGKIVIPCNYYSVNAFERERAVVTKVVAGGKLAYGYIDPSGREVIPCVYDEATTFKFKNTWVGTDQEGGMRYQLIAAEGKVILPYSVLNLQDGGKFGQAACAVQGDDGRLRYGILANSGRPILPFEYDEITIFSEWNGAENRWVEAGMATKDGTQYSFDISKRSE